jgi:hypothetical protein
MEKQSLGGDIGERGRQRGDLEWGKDQKKEA